MTSRRKHAQAMLRITQLHSRIGNQARVVRVLTDGLGLGRIGSSVELPDNPCTRGMIAKVAHIVGVEEIPAPASKRAHDEHAQEKESAAALVAAAIGAAQASAEPVETKRPRRSSAKRAEASSSEE